MTSSVSTIISSQESLSDLSVGVFKVSVSAEIRLLSMSSSSSSWLLSKT